MPDTEKLSLLVTLKWHKVKCCGTCSHAPEEVKKRVTFGHCQHPKAEYNHGKHTDKKRLPCHTLSKCKRHEECDTFGLDELNYQLKTMSSLKKVIEEERKRQKKAKRPEPWSVFFFDDSEESKKAKRALEEAELGFLAQKVSTPWENRYGTKAPCFITAEGSFEGFDNIKFLISYRNHSSE